MHPESYDLVERMARDRWGEPGGTDRATRSWCARASNCPKYVSETVGMPTLNDILEELTKPGRDPRQKFERRFRAERRSRRSEDLKPGMNLTGS